MSDNFKEDLKLDKYNLDVCALTQPELFAEWGTKWADAVNLRDRAKDNLSLVRSECDAEVRATPSAYGWDNALKTPTEAFINSAIAGHEAFVEANNAYLDACHEVNIMAVAKEAFEQRRKMIEILTQLFLSGYYSGNKDFDKSYGPAVAKVLVKETSDQLEKNPRLVKRMNHAKDSGDN